MQPGEAGCLTFDVLLKMQCVTEGEIEKWLLNRTIPSDPYHSDVSPEFYLQFYAPVRHRQLDAFTRHFYDGIIPESDTLIHMTDWGLYQQSEMIAIVGIRSSRGEYRHLIEAPGHIIPSGSPELGISLFSLTASFAWSSYLYLSQGHTTLYNWQGEIFDFWTDNEQAVSEIRLILKQFDLKETKQGEQAGAGNRRSAGTRPLT